jgi:hypothetical protein
MPNQQPLPFFQPSLLGCQIGAPVILPLFGYLDLGHGVRLGTGGSLILIKIASVLPRAVILGCVHFVTSRIGLHVSTQIGIP